MRCTLQKNSKVEIALYDAGGAEVKIVSNEFRNAGIQNVSINASSFAAGMYFIKLRTGDGEKMLKLYKY